LYLDIFLILIAVRCPYLRSYVRNGGRGQLSSEWRHSENDVIMRTGAAIGASRHNENDVTMTIAVLWRYGDWRHVATGCTALVQVTLVQYQMHSIIEVLPAVLYCW